MRLLLVPALAASLFLAVSCSSDDDTVAWVMQAVTSQSGDSNSTNLNPAPTDSIASTGSKPVTNNENNKIDLTPVLLDTTVDCKTRDKNPGVCVLYYQCNSQTKTVIDDGAGLLDLRTNNCPHYLEVCCKTKDIVDDVNITINEDESANDEDSPNRNKNKENTPGSTVTTQAPVVAAGVPKKSGIAPCGWSNPGVSPFIFRDKDAAKNDATALYGDFPWMVALLKKSGNSNVWSQADYLGGGTLIHPSVVMTAAHKLSVRKKHFQPNELKCRAGEWDTHTESELFKHQERDIAKFIEHEGYYRTSLYNDVVLLILEKPFQMKVAPHMGTACLATSAPPTNSVCYSMGWGTDNIQNKTYPNILKKVLLHVVERNTCQELLRDTRLGPTFELHESLTCASGNEGVDTCRGDGGSPLVCTVSNDPDESRFAVHGMVAYGISCFRSNVPGVYVDTVQLKSWVDAKMQEEGLDTAYYTI